MDPLPEASHSSDSTSISRTKRTRLSGTSYSHHDVGARKYKVSVWYVLGRFSPKHDGVGSVPRDLRHEDVFNDASLYSLGRSRNLRGG